jgi:hypothetical protein
MTAPNESRRSNEQTAAEGTGSRQGKEETGKSPPDLKITRKSWGRHRSREQRDTIHTHKKAPSAFDRFVKSVRPLAQIATPIIIAVIGSWYNCATQHQHDYQTAVQILNQREQSELQARTTVFEKTIPALLNKDTDIEARLLALETFLYNFHGVVNVRNVLTDLQTEIEESDRPDLEEATRSKLVKQSERLKQIARGIGNAQKQMLFAAMIRKQITVACGEIQDSDRTQGPLAVVSLALNQTVTCSISYPEPDRWFMQPEQHGHKITLVPLCVGKHTQLQSGCVTSASFEKPDPFATSARIQMTVDDHAPKDPFELTMFGSPFSDNAVIDHGHRIAVLLQEISPSVKLQVVAFPEDLVPPGYQPTITNISRLLSGESG